MARWLRYAFSGSSFGRVEVCPASAALPHADATTQYAQDGTDGHDFMAMIVEDVPRDEALARVAPDMREWCAKIDTDAVPRGRAEVAMAYNHATGLARFTGAKERRYDVTEHEIPMTLDVHAGYDPEDDSVAVIDWKFVMWEHDAEDDRPQLELQALAAASEACASCAHCTVGMIGDDGAIVWQRWTLYPPQLAEVAERVRRAAANVAAARADREEHERTMVAPWRPDVRQSASCRWCGARPYCPAKIATVAMATGGAPHTPVTLEDSGAAYLRVQDAEIWARAARAVVKEFALQGAPLPCGDGAREVALTKTGAFRVRKARGG